MRQLRTLVEQMSVIEQHREVDALTLRSYLPEESSALVPVGGTGVGGTLDSITEFADGESAKMLKPATAVVQE